MGNFINTLKHIIQKLWENILTHIIQKPLKPMRNLENTLKHTVWKPVKPMRDFENALKHIILNPLKSEDLETLLNVSLRNLWTISEIFKTLWNTSI